jgi:hypothetical protein
MERPYQDENYLRNWDQISSWSRDKQKDEILGLLIRAYS